LANVEGTGISPASFLTGFVGTLTYNAFRAWWYERGTESPTRAAELAVYAAFVVAPFLIFVIGWNRRRWDPEYDWFGDAGKADSRQVFIRFGVYWVGVIVAYAIR
jgi:hypothetical protein